MANIQVNINKPTGNTLHTAGKYVPENIDLVLLNAANIVPENILIGTNILGVVGTVVPDEAETEEKEVTPAITNEQQEVYASQGKDLVKVTVKPMPSAVISSRWATSTSAGFDLLSSQGHIAAGTKINGLTLSATDGFTIRQSNNLASCGVVNNDTGLNVVLSSGLCALSLADGATASATNLEAANIKSGVTILGVSGKLTVIDTELTDGAAAAAANILSGKKAFVNGAAITGSMPVYNGEEE